MDGLRTWLAKVAVFLDRPRRRGILITVVALWWLFGGAVTRPLVRRVFAIGDPVVQTLVVGLGSACVLACLVLGTAASTGYFRGHPLPLPQARLIRLAGERHRCVETWTSPLAVAEVIDRLTRLDLPGASAQVQSLPTGVHVIVQRWFQPDPWPASAPVPTPVKVQATALILVTADHDGLATLNAHWDDQPTLTDAMRASARLGRDVVDAARASTAQAEREPDATPGSDR